MAGFWLDVVLLAPAGVLFYLVARLRRLLAANNRELEATKAFLAKATDDLAVSRAELAAWSGNPERVIAEKTADLLKRHDELLILNAVSEALGHSLELRSILQETANRLAKIFGTSVIEISLVDEQQDNVAVVAREGAVTRCFLGEQAPLLGQGLAREVVRTGRPVAANGIFPVPEALNGSGWSGASHLAVFPVKSKERVLGTLAMISASRQRLSQQDRQILTAIGNMIGTAAGNSQLYKRIKRISDTDAVTGLYNHRFIIKRLNTEVRRAARYKHSLAVLMMDVDRFKLLNDTHGHTLGDRALKRIALATVSACRATDIIGRYGGDEFLIILPETSRNDALTVADRILERIRRLELMGERNGAGFTVTVSLGMAVYRGGPTGGKDLIDLADKNLYRSKSAGGDRLTAVGSVRS